MSLISIEVDSEPVLRALKKLAEHASDLSPALREIGEDLVDSTLRRFVTSTTPEGARWAANSDLTLQLYLGRISGAYRKGRAAAGGRGLTQKGAKALGGKKPLIGESKNLSTTITYRVVDGGRTLLVGSPEKYAATHQFGAKKGAYGRTRRGAPIPWGDVPARPFLGLSPEDVTAAEAVIRRHLARAVGG